MENTSFVKDIIDGKSCVLDILAVLQDETKVNIEVQLKNQHNMDRRSLFYWSKVYSESMKEGEDYRELPNVIAINIVDFNFPPGGDFHTRFRLREDTDTSLILSPALEIHCINMVQWRKLKEKDVRNNPLHRWMARFDESSPLELIEEAAEMDSAIMAANDKLENVMQDEQSRRHYWKREMARRDQRGQLQYARDEGLAEGKLEIALNFKKMGLSVAQIAEGTGLSIEVIEKL